VSSTQLHLVLFQKTPANYRRVQQPNPLLIIRVPESPNPYTLSTFSPRECPATLFFSTLPAFQFRNPRQQFSLLCSDIDLRSLFLSPGTLQSWDISTILPVCLSKSSPSLAPAAPFSFRPHRCLSAPTVYDTRHKLFSRFCSAPVFGSEEVRIKMNVRVFRSQIPGCEGTFLCHTRTLFCISIFSIAPCAASNCHAGGSAVAAWVARQQPHRPVGPKKARSSHELDYAPSKGRCLPSSALTRRRKASPTHGLKTRF